MFSYLVLTNSPSLKVAISPRRCSVGVDSRAQQRNTGMLNAMCLFRGT